MPSNSAPVRSILILTSDPFLGFPSALFLSCHVPSPTPSILSSSPPYVTILAHLILNKPWSTSLYTFLILQEVLSVHKWDTWLWSHIYRWQSSQAILAWSQQFTSVQWLVGMFATWCPPVQMALFHSGATTVLVLGNTHSCEYLMPWLSLLWEGRFIDISSSAIWHCVTPQKSRDIDINCITGGAWKLAQFIDLLGMKFVHLVFDQFVCSFTRWWEACVTKL